MKKSHVQLSDEERIKKRTQDFWTGKIGLGVIVGYMAYVLGAQMYLHPDMNLADLTSYVLDGMPKTFLVLSKVNPVPFLLFGIIWGIYFAIDYEKYMRTRDLAMNPHGDARFEDDFKRFDSEYVIDPNIVEKNSHKRVNTHYTPEHKKIVDRPRINSRKDRHGEYKNKIYQKCWENTQIFASKVAISLNGHWCGRNPNAVIFGGSGTGKTRFFLQPNLLQANSSYLITDPSCDIMAGYGKFLESKGYKIRCLNINNMEHGTRFNPLHYIESSEDIAVIVDILMENTGAKGGSGDKFWEKATSAFLSAAIGYLVEVCPLEQRNFYNVLNLLNMAAVPSGEEDATNTPLSLMMDELYEANPNSYAYSCFQSGFKNAPGKTANSILISTAVLLNRFISMNNFNNLCYKDEMHLERIGAAPFKLKKGAKLFPEDIERYEKDYAEHELPEGCVHVDDFEKYKDLIAQDKLGRYIEGAPYKTAVFLSIPTADKTFNWIAAMLYCLFFELAYRRGATRAAQQRTNDPRLAWPVRCLIDEASNVGSLPNVQERMATCRKYNLGIVLIYQSLPQIQNQYKEATASAIMGNCDTTLFLGGTDEKTLKMISERLGTETIKTYSSGVSFSKSNSSSQNYSFIKRNLMDRAQLERLSNDKCIVFVRGEYPFLAKKFPLQTHPNFKYTAEANKAENSYINPIECLFDDVEIEKCKIKSITEDGYIQPEEVESAFLVARKHERAKERYNLIRSLRLSAGTYAPTPEPTDTRGMENHEEYVAQLYRIARNALKYEVPDYDAETLKILRPICMSYSLLLDLEDLYADEKTLIQKRDRRRAIKNGADEAKLKELGLLDDEELDAKSVESDGTNPSESSAETSESKDENKESDKKEPPELPEFNTPHPLTQAEAKERRAHAENTLKSLRIRSGEKEDNPGIKPENCIITETYSPLAEFAPAPAVSSSIIEMMEAEGLMEKEELTEVKEDATKETPAVNAVSEAAASEHGAIENDELAQESTDESDSEAEPTSSAAELPSFAPEPEEDNFFSPDGGSFMDFSDDDEDDDFGGGFSDDDFL